MIMKAQSVANWCNMHIQVDCMRSLRHLHEHSYNHFVRSASSAITDFGVTFLF